MALFRYLLCLLHSFDQPWDPSLHRCLQGFQTLMPRVQTCRLPSSDVALAFPSGHPSYRYPCLPLVVRIRLGSACLPGFPNPAVPFLQKSLVPVLKQRHLQLWGKVTAVIVYVDQAELKPFIIRQNKIWPTNKLNFKRNKLCPAYFFRLTIKGKLSPQQ